MPPTRFSPNKASFQIRNPHGRHATPSGHQQNSSSPNPSGQPSYIHRRNLTFYDKLKILDFYHEHESSLTQQAVVTQLRTMGYTTMSQSTLSGFLKAEEMIRAYITAYPDHLHFKRRPLVKLPEVEAALHQWMLQQPHHARLTGAILCKKARDFCRLLNVPEDDSHKFSNGWLNRFRKRFGLRAYQFHDEAASVPKAEQKMADKVESGAMIAEPWK